MKSFFKLYFTMTSQVFVDFEKSLIDYWEYYLIQKDFRVLSHQKII